MCDFGTRSIQIAFRKQTSLNIRGCGQTIFFLQTFKRHGDFRTFLRFTCQAETFLVISGRKLELKKRTSVPRFSWHSLWASEALNPVCIVQKKILEIPLLNRFCFVSTIRSAGVSVGFPPQIKKADPETPWHAGKVIWTGKFTEKVTRGRCRELQDPDNKPPL